MSNLMPPYHLRIMLDTRRPIQIETSAELIAKLAQSLRSYEEIGDVARIEIVEVRQGSWWIQVLIIAGAAGAILQAANNLASEIREGRTPFGRSIAATANEGQAEICEIITPEEIIEIPKSEMRALQGMVDGENQYGSGPFGRNRFGRNAAGEDRESLPVTEDEQAPGDGSRSEELEAATSQRTISSFVGVLREGSDGLEFEPSGRSAMLVDEIQGGLSIPHSELIEIAAYVRRGSRGGLADPRLIIVDWRPADEPGQESVDIWKKGGDDEEFDLSPGKNVEDLQTISDPDNPFPSAGASNEERLMSEVMYSTPDDEELAERTKTFVGRFMQGDHETRFVTREGTVYGVLGGTRQRFDEEYVVRAQTFEHSAARWDWLRVMDVYEIEE